MQRTSKESSQDFDAQNIFQNSVHQHQEIEETKILSDFESKIHLPSFLANLSISAPCSEDWNLMTGDDKKRLCSSCKIHVYNITALESSEAEAFLASEFGKEICVKYFKRSDGTIITKNCPIGLRSLRRQGERLRKFLSSICGLLLSGISSVAYAETSLQNEVQEKGSPLPEFASPPMPEATSFTGLLDWDTVKKLQHDKTAVQSISVSELLRREVQIRSEHPHTTTEKIAVAKNYVSIGDAYYSLKQFRKASATFKKAANLLKSVDSEKELYSKLLLSIQLCRKGREQKN
jgi:hypothetical protein